MNRSGTRSRICGAPLVAAAAFTFVAGTQPALAQPPKPTTAECLGYAARFDPTNADLVKRVIACDPEHAGENIALLSARARRGQPGNDVVLGVRNKVQNPSQPLAYYTNGRFVSADEMKSFTLNAGAPNGIPVDANTLNFITAETKKQEVQSAAFNASASADTAGQNESVRQAELKRKCDYKATSVGAVSSLVSLASNSPIYTRSQLGILSAIIPVLFSHCDTTIPPAKPVLTLSGDSVAPGGTVKLTASETGYSGSFTASSSDPNTAKVVDPTTKVVGDGKNGTVVGSTSFDVTAGANASGTVTLTVTDDRGTKSTISLVIK